VGLLGDNSTPSWGQTVPPIEGRKEPSYFSTSRQKGGGEGGNWGVCGIEQQKHVKTQFPQRRIRRRKMTKGEMGLGGLSLKKVVLPSLN